MEDSIVIAKNDRDILNDNEWLKISELTEIERKTRISMEEAMLMKTSDEEKRISWNFIKTFLTAALSGHSLGKIFEKFQLLEN